MKILKTIILSLALLCSPVLAQDVEAPVIVYTPTWEIQPNQPPSNHIFFLVDGSGSMDGQKASLAMSFAMEIAGAPVDDLEIAIATFGSNVQRWPGTEDIGPDGNPISLPNWSVMPSAENLALANEWLASHMDGGGTHVIPGLNHVFHSCSGEDDSLGIQSITVEDLTIIILTDGLFSESVGPGIGGMGILAAIASLQQDRIDNNLSPAVIGVIGIEINETGQDKLCQIAGDLGFLRLDIVEDGEE
jgi:Mg-chelatase subunit ChlD